MFNGSIGYSGISDLVQLTIARNGSEIPYATRVVQFLNSGIQSVSLIQPVLLGDGDGVSVQWKSGTGEQIAAYQKQLTVLKIS